MLKMKRKRKAVVTFIVCALLISSTVGMFFISISKNKKQQELKQQEISRQQEEQQRIQLKIEQDVKEKERQEELKKKKETEYIVKENDKVENSYFDDAVFIGNSRTQGLMLYGGITNAKFYADKGLMIDKVDEKAISIMGETQKDTVMSALRRNKFSKYYIMLGTNELGWAYENIFIKDYQKLIDDIKQINPDGIIYLQSILPVSKQKSDTDQVYNNPNVENYNNIIKNLAKDNGVYYINVAEQFKDEEGNLLADSSSDGIHLKADFCKQWAEYLTTHTISSKNELKQDNSQELSDEINNTEEI